MNIDNLQLLLAGVALFVGTCFLPLLAKGRSGNTTAYIAASDFCLTVVSMLICIAAFHNWLVGALIVISIGIFGSAVFTAAGGSTYPVMEERRAQRRLMREARKAGPCRSSGQQEEKQA